MFKGKLKCFSYHNEIIVFVIGSEHGDKFSKLFLISYISD